MHLIKTKISLILISIGPIKNFAGAFLYGFNHLSNPIIFFHHLILTKPRMNRRKLDAIKVGKGIEAGAFGELCWVDEW